MADGITVQWKNRSGSNVSLCDGPARGAGLLNGPRDGSGRLALTAQEIPGLRVTAKQYVSRGNASENFTLRVSGTYATLADAFYAESIWPSTLAPQANLSVTLTVGVTPTTYFLNNAVLTSVDRNRLGLSVDFTFNFSGGLWTTS